MLREHAIDAASVWLQSRGQRFGDLRFAHYAWDYQCGHLLWGGHYTRSLITIPTFGRPDYYWLVHGWVTVFNPLDHVPVTPEDCFSVWIPESGGEIRGRMPRSLEWELTVSLTGSGQ
jgi:hypothetical protein